MANCERPLSIPANLLPNDPVPIPPFWGCTELCQTVMYICHFFECDNCSAYHHKAAIMDKWTIKTPNPTKLLQHPKQMTSKDDIKGLVSLKSLRPWLQWSREQHEVHRWVFCRSCRLLYKILRGTTSLVNAKIKGDQLKQLFKL